MRENEDQNNSEYGHVLRSNNKSNKRVFLLFLQNSTCRKLCKEGWIWEWLNKRHHSLSLLDWVYFSLKFQAHTHYYFHQFSVTNSKEVLSATELDQRRKTDSNLKITFPLFWKKDTYTMPPIKYTVFEKIVNMRTKNQMPVLVKDNFLFFLDINVLQYVLTDFN